MKKGPFFLLIAVIASIVAFAANVTTILDYLFKSAPPNPETEAPTPRSSSNSISIENSTLNDTNVIQGKNSSAQIITHPSDTSTELHSTTGNRPNNK